MLAPCALENSRDERKTGRGLAAWTVPYCDRMVEGWAGRVKKVLGKVGRRPLPQRRRGRRAAQRLEKGQGMVLRAEFT